MSGNAVNFKLHNMKFQFPAQNHPWKTSQPNPNITQQGQQPCRTLAISSTHPPYPYLAATAWNHSAIPATRLALWVLNRPVGSRGNCHYFPEMRLKVGTLGRGLGFWSAIEAVLWIEARRYAAVGVWRIRWRLGLTRKWSLARLNLGVRCFLCQALLDWYSRVSFIDLYCDSWLIRGVHSSMDCGKFAIFHGIISLKNGVLLWFFTFLQFHRHRI